MTEKVEKRGRPKKSTNTLDVNDLLCEYLSTKTDKYDNEVSYYKIVDKNVKHKMSAIFAQQCDECKMPFWKTEDSEYILKVKKKYDKASVNDETNLPIFLNIIFKYYCMETDNGLLQGYYVKNVESNEDKDNKN